MSYADVLVDVDPSNKGNNTDLMPMIPASRPLLVFNHNPKAGGQSIKEHLKQAKTRTVHCTNNEREYGCKPEVWEQALSGDVNNTLVIVPEFSGSVPKDRVQQSDGL